MAGRSYHGWGRARGSGLEEGQVLSNWEPLIWRRKLANEKEIEDNEIKGGRERGKQF